jgi:ribosomal protein S18 acetylase RimI-like enzyme
MLAESPTAFGSDYAESSARPLEHFRERVCNEPENFIIGAFVDDDLIGSVGGFREQETKRRHITSIVGMYVHPEHRRSGIGRELLSSAVERLETLPGVERIQLAVTVGNDHALALYQSAGFEVYGREPDALKVDGSNYDELLLSRRCG